jgi:hypothetical protein
VHRERSAVEGPLAIGETADVPELRLPDTLTDREREIVGM